MKKPGKSCIINKEILGESDYSRKMIMNKIWESIMGIFNKQDNSNNTDVKSKFLHGDRHHCGEKGHRKYIFREDDGAVAQKDC